MVNRSTTHKDVAETRIREALDFLSALIRQIVWRLGEEVSSSSDLSELNTKEFIDVAWSFNLNSSSINLLPFQGAPYYRALPAHIKQGRSNLREVLSTYAPYLPLNLVVETENLANHYFLIWMKGLETWAEKTLGERKKDGIGNTKIVSGRGTSDLDDWFPYFDLTQSISYSELIDKLTKLYGKLPPKREEASGQEEDEILF